MSEHEDWRAVVRLGAVLTAHHVVTGWRGIGTRCECGRTFPSRVVHRDHVASEIQAAIAADPTLLPWRTRQAIAAATLGHVAAAWSPDSPSRLLLEGVSAGLREAVTT